MQKYGDFIVIGQINGFIEVYESKKNKIVITSKIFNRNITGLTKLNDNDLAVATGGYGFYFMNL